ncbi:MAG TPA: hypothetical protein PK501_06650, partial [Thiotrichales bacterium]|nr:hypothetical protein [Thiotrichales bacterium]
PNGAKRSLIDPFAPKSRAGWWLFVLLVLLAGLSWWQWQQLLLSAPVSAESTTDAAKVTQPSATP